MASYDYRQMEYDLIQAGIELHIDPTWTDEEVYNYIVHQYNISFLNRDAWEFINESRTLGVNKSKNPFTGRFR